MNSIKRYQILYRLKQYNANNTKSNTELLYQSPFELLIAVLLSAQSTDIQVNKATQVLFKVAKTPKAILSLGLEEVKNYIRSIGLYNIKSKNIIQICHVLVNQYSGVVPNSRVKLESLPGVGRKTANIVLNLIFNRPTIAVDTHVFRFCNRSRFAIGKNVTAVEKKLLLVVPREFKKNCHQWFITHGRDICRARVPNCYNCVIQDLCEFRNKYT